MKHMYLDYMWSKFEQDAQCISTFTKWHKSADRQTVQLKEIF